MQGKRFLTHLALQFILKGNQDERSNIEGEGGELSEMVRIAIVASIPNPTRSTLRVKGCALCKSTRGEEEADMEG